MAVTEKPIKNFPGRFKGNMRAYAGTAGMWRHLREIVSPSQPHLKQVVRAQCTTKSTGPKRSPTTKEVRGSRALRKLVNKSLQKNDAQRGASGGKPVQRSASRCNEFFRGRDHAKTGCISLSRARVTPGTKIERNN